MPFSQTNDVRIHYEERGRGRALLLLMGFATPALGFRREFVDALATGFRTVGVDARGTGRSDHPDEPYSMRDMASDALGVIDTLGLEDAAVLGASMGGMIAQEMALAAPERVSQLILVGSSPGRAPDDLPREPMPLPPSVTDPAWEAATREGWRRSFSAKFAEANGPYIDSIVEQLRRQPTPPHTFARHGEATASFSTLGRLGEIEQSTLIVHGAEDASVGREAAEALAAGIPDARFVVVSGAGHATMNERPIEVAELVRGFLA